MEWQARGRWSLQCPWAACGPWEQAGLQMVPGARIRKDSRKGGVCEQGMWLVVKAQRRVWVRCQAVVETSNKSAATTGDLLSSDKPRLAGGARAGRAARCKIEVGCRPCKRGVPGQGCDVVWRTSCPSWTGRRQAARLGRLGPPCGVSGTVSDPQHAPGGWHRQWLDGTARGHSILRTDTSSCRRAGASTAMRPSVNSRSVRPGTNATVVRWFSCQSPGNECLFDERSWRS